MDNRFVFTDRINARDYLRLREEAGWKAIAYEQAQAGLDRSFAKVAVTLEGETVGMARLLWDGGYCAYLTDIVVTERCRHSGIGSEMIRRLTDTIKAEKKEGWQIKIHLLAAPGKEGFYEQFGFGARPNDHAGAGMDMWI